MGGQRHVPVALPLGKKPVPIAQAAGCLKGRSEEERKMSPSPEFDPRTVQPVARCYTEYGIPAHKAGGPFDFWDLHWRLPCQLTGTLWMQSYYTMKDHVRNKYKMLVQNLKTTYTISTYVYEKI